MSAGARPADSARARRVKGLVYALLLLGVLAGTALALRTLGQLYARVATVQAQASALNLARRPEPAPALRWWPDTVTPALDGVTREDVRQAYLLGHAELTYARRSGDTTGLPGVYTGAALLQARQGARGLLLDWSHVAQFRAVRLSGPTAADGDSVELRDRFWSASARPAGQGWTDIVIARRALDVTLRRADGRWRITALRPITQEQPLPVTPPALTPGTWHALTLPKDWATWTPETWDTWLARVRRLGLGPLWAPLSSPPTRPEVLALKLGLNRARHAGVGLVPAFAAPLTLEAVPLRAQVISQLPPGTLAFDPGTVDVTDAGSVAAVGALRLAAPRVPLVAALRGKMPDVAAARRAGLSGVKTADAAVAARYPERLLTLPGKARLPWKRKAAEAALAAAGARNGWQGTLTDLLGPDGQPTARGSEVIRMSRP